MSRVFREEKLYNLVNIEPITSNVRIVKDDLLILSLTIYIYILLTFNNPHEM